MVPAPDNAAPTSAAAITRGNRTRVKIVKNKVAPPFRAAEFDIMYNEGISKSGGLLDVGTDLGIVRKTGSFYSFGDVRLGQGRENSKEFVKRNTEISQEIERQIREKTLAAKTPLVIEANDAEAPAELESVL